MGKVLQLRQLWTAMSLGPPPTSVVRPQGADVSSVITDGEIRETYEMLFKAGQDAARAWDQAKVAKVKNN